MFHVYVLFPGCNPRFIIYEKGIEDKIDIVSPGEIGGMKSEEFLKMNPHGKVQNARDRRVLIV